MIETIVIGYLNNRLSVPAYAERQENPETEYILVEKTGGGRRNLIENAMITIQSYAGSKFRAAQINQEVKAAMDQITALDNVSACKLNSDYDYTDTETKSYRYQAVYDITFFDE